MKITSIRHDKDAGREMMTVYDADVLMEKMKLSSLSWKVLNPHSLILTNFHVSILLWSAPGLKTEGEE